MILHVLQREDKNKIPNPSDLLKIVDFILQQVMRFGCWKRKLRRQSSDIMLDTLALDF